MRREALWHEKAAHKLGLAALDYTPTRIGQTLHIPCSRGHVVDYPLNTRLPPEQVAKRLMQRGWTVGSKLTCPKHSKKSKAPTSAPQQENEDMATITNPPTSVGIAPKGLPTSVVALCKTCGTDCSEGSCPGLFPKPAQTSDAARTAKRAVMQWLDEAFDVAKGTYNAGVSDDSIAKETGLSPVKVKELREEFYGPLGVPPELQAVRNELAAIKAQAEKELAQIRQNADVFITEVQRSCDAHIERIEKLIKLNGWRS